MAIFRNNNKILKQNFKFPSIGNGLKFDGVNDYVSFIGSQYSLSNMSLCINIKFSKNTGTQYVYTSVNNRQAGAPAFSTTGNKLYFQYQTLTSTFLHEANFSFVANVFYTIYVVKNGSSVTFYINNVSYSAPMVYTDNTVTTFTGNFTLGNDTTFSPRQFEGTIYDFKLFDKALTNTEISVLYNSNNNLIPNSAISNIVLNYNFNEKQGTTLKDSSQSGLNGTLVNYTGSDTTLGVGNKWVDENGNPILV